MSATYSADMPGARMDIVYQLRVSPPRVLLSGTRSEPVWCVHNCSNALLRMRARELMALIHSPDDDEL